MKERTTGRRPFDIDIVVNRTVVYGSLAAFITIVYLAIVVGAGSLLGTGDEPNVGLQVAATAVVAVAFQPVRQRVQRLANRLVFGERATPYEVMTDFAERISGALSLEDALPQMADAAARGVGATSATIRLFLPDGSERAVTSPPDGQTTGDTRSVDVMHGGERVGSLSVTKRASEAITPAEEGLLSDVAAQAGLALRNVRLTLELEERVRQIELQAEQLRRSRQRLVTARDVQRRRLERDVREGAQRQLERIGGHLRDARALLEESGERAVELLEQIETETALALDRLRDLARGIFPPLLADEGIAPALEAHMRKLGVPGELSERLNSARFDPDVEAAVYFCCIQALQNAVRHAPGSRVEVTMARRDDDLVFSIRDNGGGFDPEQVQRGMGFEIMHDRMEALGGTLEVVSSPGSGTTVTGRVPARVAEAVPS